MGFKVGDLVVDMKKALKWEKEILRYKVTDNFFFRITDTTPDGLYITDKDSEFNTFSESELVKKRHVRRWLRELKNDKK